MAVTPTYPGVYIQELPSGVRTIAGVSTSVAAFIGGAKFGPVLTAQHIFSNSDYERLFGGLDQASEMSYAVRQFFLNGGSEAWIVRVAGASAAAKASATAGAATLNFTAELGGFGGNAITAYVDYLTPYPDSTFNLTFVYQDPYNANAAPVVERFANVSMNPSDPAYVLTSVNAGSALAQATLAGAINAAGGAQSVSGVITTADLTAGFPGGSASKNFGVSLNGDAPVTVTITQAVGAGGLAGIAAAIKAQVANIRPGPLYASFDCTAGGNQITLKASSGGAADSIRITSGSPDAAGVLRLGSQNGGSDVDAAAGSRPQAKPQSGMLLGGAIDETMTIATGSTAGTLGITLDGDAVHTVQLADHAVVTDLRLRLGAIAKDLQTQVALITPANSALASAYKNFTATVTRQNKLLLTSGSTGPQSKVKVSTLGGGPDLFTLLLLNVGGAEVDAGAITFGGGTESPPPYSQSNYDAALSALDHVDFNILCIPGVNSSGVLADATAYAQSRRAFYVADPPFPDLQPDDMATYFSGASVPKSAYGAMYYPYLMINDPLVSGAQRTVAPSGSIAGIYARTDATRGVWKAPAGTDAAVSGAVAVDVPMVNGQNGELNVLGLNAIRNFPVYGIVSWGARTFVGSNDSPSDYKYIPVRRFANFIEESLYRGTQWVVFEPNGPALWAEIRKNVGAFMQELFRQGAFFGNSPRDAYFVKCDAETTTPTDTNLGIVNIVVGFAPLKPAEFVIITIQQIAGAASA